MQLQTIQSKNNDCGTAPGNIDCPKNICIDDVKDNNESSYRDAMWCRTCHL